MNDSRGNFNGFEMDRSLVSSARTDEDSTLESSLRPRMFRDYVGQQKVRDGLYHVVRRIRARGEVMDHLLLNGPPGLGKRTLAHVVANELGVDIKRTVGPQIEKSGELVALLTDLEERDILFIDEIHRLDPSVEAVLCAAMKDFKLDSIRGRGSSAKIAVDRFTLVGATARARLLSAPLRARFRIVERLNLYGEDELADVIRRSATLLEVQVTDEGAAVIARRARGTPRIANRLLRRVRDYAQAEARGKITEPVALHALRILEVDEYGFDDMARKILRTIIERFGGGPVDLNMLAAVINEDPGTIADVHEPFLIQIGFILSTPLGRVASPRAFRHFGIDPAKDQQRSS